jgi:hypothetical protein
MEASLGTIDHRLGVFATPADFRTRSVGEAKAAAEGRNA